MITNIGSVCVFVKDQQRAKSFYTEMLGMELRRDDPMPNESGDRWISVAPPDSKTELVLYQQGDAAWSHYESTYGTVQSITLLSDDLVKTLDTLRAQGVKVLIDTSVQEWGSFAMIEDSEDNSLLLVQPSQ